MKIIFMGTPEFALPSLDAMSSQGWEIGAVVTQPDRQAGRGRKMVVPPVKRRAEELGLEVWQPEKVTDPDFSDRFKILSPDLIVGAAFGQYIPTSILKSAPRGGINLHPSLLPKYRGAAPIAWALINGDEKTGVTVHYLSREMDGGDILAQEVVAINFEDNASTLSQRLAELGARLLVQVIGEIKAGTVEPQSQDEAHVTYAPKLSKADGRLDWGKPAIAIHNRIRGLTPWPGVYTLLPTPKGDKLFKVIKSRIIPEGRGKPGEVLEASPDKFIIATGEGAIQVISLQLEGKKSMMSPDFLRGHRIAVGEVLR